MKGKKRIIPDREAKKMNELLKIAQVNHQFLIKKLSSKKGSEYSGKWIAVAKKNFFVDNSRKKVISKIKKIQPERNKILLIQIPKYKHLSLSF